MAGDPQSQTVPSTAPPPLMPVTVRDLDMPFGSLVWMLIKVGFAAIPAAIVVGTAVLAFWIGLLAMVLGGAGLLPQQRADQQQAQASASQLHDTPVYAGGGFASDVQIRVYESFDPKLSERFRDVEPGVEFTVLALVLDSPDQPGYYAVRVHAAPEFTGYVIMQQLHDSPFRRL